jgi:hypothetical protein
MKVYEGGCIRLLLVIDRLACLSVDIPTEQALGVSNFKTMIVDTSITITHIESDSIAKDILYRFEPEFYCLASIYCCISNFTDFSNYRFFSGSNKK